MLGSSTISACDLLDQGEFDIFNDICTRSQLLNLHRHLKNNEKDG